MGVDLDPKTRGTCELCAQKAIAVCKPKFLLQANSGLDGSDYDNCYGTDFYAQSKAGGKIKIYDNAYELVVDRKKSRLTCHDTKNPKYANYPGVRGGRMYNWFMRID